ncbi:hypothetical protein POF50_008880 [Streptomyces sp. SL13]|uniref:Uncharacterized protein n=1 Tax=Streptantibioticus silvisoli TaxID=2705255 RepID=A0AA90GWL6_9ACTN|nr:hypothetical protein [Streptantibioticus silvisoli]MDI5969453.1 hypothetical protein [Streptantibioticus silvisoli]
MAEQRETAALAEIEWCCELMIAAASLHGDRLSLDVIDAVLGVRPRCAARPACRPPGPPASQPRPRPVRGPAWPTRPAPHG